MEALASGVRSKSSKMSSGWAPLNEAAKIGRMSSNGTDGAESEKDENASRYGPGRTAAWVPVISRRRGQSRVTTIATPLTPGNDVPSCWPSLM
jgi:hypothetical protein